jgi:hypothetical protein
MFVNGADKYLSLFYCFIHCEFLCYLPTKKKKKNLFLLLKIKNGKDIYLYEESFRI